MSSTNRGAQRMENDYYVTPISMVESFLYQWFKDEPEACDVVACGNVLDPCAGGNVAPVDWEYKHATAKSPAKVIRIPPTPMSYPTVIHSVFGGTCRVDTNDIRADSPAEWHYDYLTAPPSPVGIPPLPVTPYDLVITNPPFASAMEVIERGRSMVRPLGWVVMLLRLGFLGSAKRLAFFRAGHPERVYVHHERPSFLPTGETDSIEYAHMVWRVGVRADYAKMRVI